MKVSELLKQAKSLIEDEEHWCCGLPAKDKAGNLCFAESPEAVSWCSVGALWKINPPSRIENGAYALLRKHMGMNIDNFNDSYTHKEVMKAWDAAIQEAEELE